MKLRDLSFFYQVGGAGGIWGGGRCHEKNVVLRGIQGKILDVKEGSPKNFFQFCIDGICNDTNSLPEYQKPVFLTFRN